MNETPNIISVIIVTLSCTYITIWGIRGLVKQEIDISWIGKKRGIQAIIWGIVISSIGTFLLLGVFYVLLKNMDSSQF